MLGDMAIFSKYLYVDFSFNLFVYLCWGLVIEDFVLDSVIVNICKVVDDDYNNMQVLLGCFFLLDILFVIGEKWLFYLDV